MTQLFGRMAAIKLEKAVYTLLLSNPSSFFSVGNANFDDGTDSALSLAALGAAEQMFTDMVDANGDPIMLTPQTLLVPSALKTSARSLLNSVDLVGSSTDNVPVPSGNPFAKQFDLLTTPWLNAQSLTGSSAKAWYLMASPGDMAAMEMAFLGGQQAPTIETADTSFDSLGMEMRAFHDFGVSMGNPRSAVKMKGEV